jgi:glucokinase
MIAGVDIGGTKIAVGVVDGNGHVLSSIEFPTDATHGFKNALKRIVEALQGAAVSAGVEISGIGIGCTGPIDPFTGVIGDVNFLPGWQGENPVHHLEQIFKVSAAMENDADAAALGEAAWGAGKGKRTLVYVTVGTGIGGGIILDGHLYRGVEQAHPEIGHHVIDSSGPLCFCGARGCWEVLARGPAMVEWLQSKAPKNYPHLAELTGKRICELAEQGEPLARQTVEREASYLGLGLANLVTLFAPEAIVLGGSVMKSAPLFRDGIRKTIRQNCGLVPFEKTELTLASLGANTALIGAARVWHHRFTQVGG